MITYPPNYPTESTVGRFVALVDATQEEYRIASINPSECLGVAGDFTPYGTALEFMLIPIPGSDFQYYIKSINPPNLYIEDYSQNTISFIGNIPAPTGSNSAIFKLQMDEDNEYYRIVLDVSSADQFVTLTHETEGVSADLKVQVKSGGKGKTQKWKFVKGGTDDDNK